jgi:hypothetical protein
MNEFKAELKALMLKYNVELEEEEIYDGFDEYCGSDWLFKSKDWIISIQEIKN